MGVYTRRDSDFYYLWLEPVKRREKTTIAIGTTVVQRQENRKLAETLYHQRMTELARQIHRLPAPANTTVFKTFAATYQTDHVALHTEAGADRERDILKLLVAFFGNDTVAAINQPRVREYIKVRRATTVPVTKRLVSANTVNREVDTLKSMLREAVVAGLIEVSPLVGMKRLRIVKTKKRLLQKEEEARLLKVATDPQDYAIIVLGIDTLARLGDLVDLKRSDRDGLWLSIPDPKQNTPYEAPLSPRCVKALNAITHTEPYYFAKFRRAVNPRDWRSSVRKRLQRLCAAASPPVPFGQWHHGITFHGATRKTGATRLLVEKKKPLSVVQALGNWKTPDVLLAVYTEAQRRDLLDAVGQAPPKGKLVRTAQGRTLRVIQGKGRRTLTVLSGKRKTA